MKDLQTGGGAGIAAPAREIDLKELFRTVSKRLWIVIASTVLFGFLGGLISAAPTTPLYSSSSRVILAAGTPELVSTLRALIREPVVMERAIQDSGIPLTADELGMRISVRNVDTSVISVITAVDTDPKAATVLANAVANAFIKEARELLSYDGAKLISPAVYDKEAMPINPGSNRALYVGIFVGFLLGIGIVFLVDSLDDSIGSARNLEKKLDVKCLGEVPSIRKKDWFGKHKRKNEYMRGESVGS